MRLALIGPVVLLLAIAVQGVMSQTVSSAAPSNWTNAPSNWTNAPSNWTNAPSNWTYAPSNWTYAPSNWTYAPSNWTNAPSNWTYAPSNWTYAPSNWTDAPSNWTDAPSNWTYAPSNWTYAPSNWTYAPSNWTYAPSNWTYAPSNWTYAPSNWTYAPSNWTHAPSNWTDAPPSGPVNYEFSATFPRPFSVDQFDAAVEAWTSFNSLPNVTVVVSSIVAPALRAPARKLLQSRTWTVRFRFEGEGALQVAGAFMQLPNDVLSSRFGIATMSASAYQSSWNASFVQGWLNIKFVGMVAIADDLVALPEALKVWCLSQYEFGCGTPTFVYGPEPTTVSWSWPANTTTQAQSFYALPQSFLYSQFGFVYLSGTGIVPPSSSIPATANILFTFVYHNAFDEGLFRQQLASALGIAVDSLNVTLSTSPSTITPGYTNVKFYFTGSNAVTFAQELLAMPSGDRRATFDIVQSGASPIETTSSSDGVPGVYIAILVIAAIVFGIAVGFVVRRLCRRASGKSVAIVEGVLQGNEDELSYKVVKTVV